MNQEGEGYLNQVIGEKRFIVFTCPYIQSEGLRHFEFVESLGLECIGTLTPCGYVFIMRNIFEN